MIHKPIQLQDLSLIYPHKTCFQAFSGHIHFGDRIAIIGRNGVGKSTLLQKIHGRSTAIEGKITIPSDVCSGYVPQIIHDFPKLSGGQKLNKLLTATLAADPNLLLLDEPTNHLDNRNRRSLIRMLQQYTGTLILVSHDIDLINATANILWHIDAQCIHVFSGCYHDYQQACIQKKAGIRQELTQLSKQKKEMHLGLMKEQERNKQTRIRGEKHIAHRKWPTIRSHSKLAHSVKTSDKRLAQINDKKHQLMIQQSMLSQTKVIQPKFKLNGTEHHKSLITIQDASMSYTNGPIIIQNLHFHMSAKARVALCGDNGSGKSTLIKAIINEPLVHKTGLWVVPHRADVGYLDQHYEHLDLDKTVQDMMMAAMPKESYVDVRAHLNTFLFRKNEEVQTLIRDLSGGEKARLSLALIAANPPKLLLLDELTNNLDLETRAHVIQVLSAFPGAIMVISHDDDFLKAIGIENLYQINQGKIL